MTRLYGWGRSLSADSDVVNVVSPDDLRHLLAQPHRRGVTPRGLGRAYGDAAINSGGTVALLQQHGTRSQHLAEQIEIDSTQAIARVSAGVSIEQMLQVLVPAGFFVPVTPGTRFVTLGGAVAADIHGKNHHRDGSFGDHVRSMSVMLASGEMVVLDRTTRPDWFWATVGGMGLTGIVLDAVIDLIPITSPSIEVATTRCGHIDELFALMSDSESDDQYRYSVAWIDMLARGNAFGRGVLTRGNHTELTDGPQTKLSYAPKTRVSVPRFFPNGVLNLATIRAFNELWYRKSPKDTQVTQESVTNYFHPLDGVREWNRMYGSRGFLQYQCVVPLHAKEVIKQVIAKMQEAKLPTFLAVLKRMGGANQGLLSFPMEGWTLAVDIAVGSERIAAVLRDIDETVIACGGRHYLAKDAHMAPSIVRRGYQRLGEWQDIQRQMDPTGLWTSDLARRLQLIGETQ